MSVSYHDFFKSAETLLKNADSTEIDFRNLISRSYYAVFLLSREIADKFDKSVNTDSSGGSHEKVIVKFENHPDKRLNACARAIRISKVNRHRADYDIHIDIKRKDSAEHFHHSKGLITKLENLKGNLNPTV